MPTTYEYRHIMHNTKYNPIDSSEVCRGHLFWDLYGDFAVIKSDEEMSWGSFLRAEAEMLSSMGKEGWELIQKTASDYYFKRTTEHPLMLGVMGTNLPVEWKNTQTAEIKGE